MQTSPARLVISVAVTCLVAAIGLAATYAIAGPRIAEQEKRAEQAALAAVLPDADEFVAMSDDVLQAAQDAAGDSTVSAVYKANDVSGNTVGWGIRIASRGYGGPIPMVIGMDRDGKVVGLSILSMNETPGLGARVQTEEWFLDQYLGLPEGYTEKDVKKLDTISGATKSSRGVRNSVIAAGAIYDEVLAGSAQ